MSVSFYSKICTSLVVAALCVAPISAAAKSGWEAVAGVNVDSGTYTNLTTKSGIGYQVGGLYNFALDSKAGVSTGLLYRGHMYKMTEPTFSLEFESTTTFLEVPVNYNYSLTDNWRVHGGAYYAFPLSKTQFKLVGGLTSEETSNADYGLSLGVGYSVDKFNFDVTYKLGLADTAKNDNVETKLSSISLSAGYNF